MKKLGSLLAISVILATAVALIYTGFQGVKAVLRKPQQSISK
jgi:hypothetical protein